MLIMFILIAGFYKTQLSLLKVSQFGTSNLVISKLSYIELVSKPPSKT